MMRFRTALFGVIAAAGLMAVTSGVMAGPASADDLSDAITKLQSDNLYVAGDIGDIKVSEDSARASLAGTKVKVAVLGSTAGDPTALAKQIGQAVGGDVTVGVFVGTRYGAGSNYLGSGCAAVSIDRAVTENLTQLKATKDLTATIQRFAQLASTAPTSRSCTSTGNGNTGGSSGGGSSNGSSGGSSGWAILGVFGLLGAGGIGALLWRRKRKDKQALADARAAIQPYYDRLAADIGSLQPADNMTARQALADASERFNSGGSQLASANSLAQLGGARRSILEGLQATRTARTALGLDPGPELPPLAETTAPQLTEAQQVNVNGQNIQGYPQYQPGAPYYFAGGGGYAGGWYSVPFWQTLLIAEALSPGWGWGFGGGWGGYGYGSGYDSGFNQGFEQGQQSDGGANSSGGDWGGGGGDWGGGGGGGDWGGGGGDWGGGGGGGDW
ncbi:hypothetical protein ACSMXN_09990 [Jatrophihabitans sp. DSM 45814]